MTHGWPKESCIKALQKCADEIGHSPSWNEYEEWRQNMKPPAGAIRRRFGSWNAAKREAGLETTDPPGW